MANWYLELSHPHWELFRLQHACRAWLRFNKAYLNSASITVHDWQKQTVAAKELLALRTSMTHYEFTAEHNVNIAISVLPGFAPRLHLVFNGGMIAASEWNLLERQLLAFYQQENLQLSTAVKPTETNDVYWLKRLQTLPPAPVFNSKINVLPEYHYTHLYGSLKPAEYKNLQLSAEKNQLSLAIALLTMMTDLLQSKALFPWFRINLSLLNRLPLYPYSGDRANYATSVTSLPLSSVDGASFIARARAFDEQLSKDRLHLQCETLALLNQVAANELSTSPLLLTIAVEQGMATLEQAFYSEPANIMYYEGFQPKPAFMVDIWEQGYTLQYRWSFIEKLYLS